MVNDHREIQEKQTKGLMDIIILQIVDECPVHGYKILLTIRKNFGIYVGPSTIYPMLNTLEKNGYVDSKWDTDEMRPKRMYKITNKGHSALLYAQSSLIQICQNIDNIKKNIENLQIHMISN